MPDLLVMFPQEKVLMLLSGPKMEFFQTGSIRLVLMKICTELLHVHNSRTHLNNNYSSEPNLIPKSSFTSFPPPSDRSHQTSSSINQYQQSNIGSNFISGNVSRFSLGYNPLNNHVQNQLLNKLGAYRGDYSNISNNLMPPNLPHQNGLLPLQLHQPRLHHQFDDARDPWSENGWPKLRSKYMSSDEIENILRMQLAATHSNDPYTDDYYHQSCLAKRTSGSKPRHRFCPSSLRDGGPLKEPPHPFLQVDALGRVSFSSVRRPRPLLEVDLQNSSGTWNVLEKKKTLEQEPMLVARAIIEDGFCFLLDVDDIDRFLQFNQLHDIGVRLRERRQELLERVAMSFHVVDLLDKNGHSVDDIASEDDHVFLRLLSFSKGRKLVSKYMKLLLSQGDELVRVISMEIHKHLRFLFGSSLHDAYETTKDLSKIVSFCVNQMDLKSLSACLASVVCSPEQPPLRPIGSSAGNGGSVILRSLLDRATEILRDCDSSTGTCSVTNRAFWQASFNSFFARHKILL